jgi:transposase
MRKLKEVLRLHYEVRLGQREIARSVQVAQSTIHEYLSRAQRVGLGWPLPDGWGDAELEAALFAKSPRPRVAQPALPDFAHLEAELQRHRDLTLQLLWEEYRQANPEGFCYSRFCVLYRRWKKKRDVVLRQDHRAGEKMFVDWAGATIPFHHRQSAEPSQACVFVAVLGASSYAYAEATHDQQLPSWIGAHVRAFEFFGGCPQLVIPDNTKTGVNRACRYDPDLNPTYQEMAAHYGVGVLPTRPYRARDKAKVESGVQVVQRWIVAALRHRTFFALEQVNQAIRELLHKLNQRPFKKREGSRASLFAALDQPALQTLPATAYDLSQWCQAKVNIDYHVAFDGNFYSVPYRLVQEEVDVRSTPTTVEIFHKGQRVASHGRSRGHGLAITEREHRPKSHQAHLEWTPSRMVHWAGTIGPHTAQLVERILADKPHPEMGYRSSLGVIRLAEQYSAARLEAAAERALRTGACRYRSLKSILKSGLDQQPLLISTSPPVLPPQHDNLRGAEYFADQEGRPCSNNR